MNRPLHELELRVGILKDLSDELREQCIAIARDKSPSASMNLARLAASQHGVLGMNALAITKATRWLSVIRRDYGQKEFDETVGTLTQSRPRHTPRARKEVSDGQYSTGNCLGTEGAGSC